MTGARLADLVKAFSILAPSTESERHAVTDALGLEARRREPVSAPPEMPRATTAEKLAPDRARPAAAATEVAPSRLEVLEVPAAMEAPGWALSIPPLPPPSDSREPPMALEPLFEPRRAGAIIRAALESGRRADEVDLERAVLAAVRGQLQYDLPRRTLATLSRGAQILVDEGEAMQPFNQDQISLIGQITRVVGSGRVSVLGFFGLPKRGVRPIRRWLDEAQLGARISEDLWSYVPPPRRTPVAVLTDLGCMREFDVSGRSWPRDWRRFASRLRALGCPVAVFCPYPPELWPPGLSDSMAIIHWDRGTSAGDVQRLMRTVFGRSRQGPG